METPKATLDDVRHLFADMMAAASGTGDPRIQRAFEAVPREAFLPPGPWTLAVGNTRVQTPTADPAHLYQNVLVTLDASQGINTGEPQLHAAWIGAVAPQSGEAVTHIGAGAGYYTAILAMLVLPGGTVTAFEVHARLAADARRNLQPFDNVRLIAGNALELPLPASDVIYVNAGVVAPPVAWLEALRPAGRLIFPWRPTDGTGIAVRVTRTSHGLAATPLMSSFFIGCVGGPEPGEKQTPPEPSRAWQIRSVRLTAQERPDASAVAVYPDVWFSDRPPRRRARDHRPP